MASIWHDMFNAEEGERKKEKKIGRFTYYFDRSIKWLN